MAGERHFGRAAARHHIAAQAFGRRIRRLESDLGVTLFHRTSRRITLAPDGERVLARAAVLLTALDRLAEQAADTAATWILSRVERPLPGTAPGAISTLNSSAEAFRP